MFCTVVSLASRSSTTRKITVNAFVSVCTVVNVCFVVATVNEAVCSSPKSQRRQGSGEITRHPADSEVTIAHESKGRLNTFWTFSVVRAATVSTVVPLISAIVFAT